MSFFGKSNKTNDDIDRESKENHQDINNKIKEEICTLQSYTSFLSITLPFAVYTGVARGVSIIAGPIGWYALGGYSIYSLIKTSGKLTSTMMSVVVFIAMTIYGKSFSVDENRAPLWVTSDSIEYQEYQNNQYRIIQLNDKVKILSKDLTLSQEKAQKNRGG